MLGFSSRQVNPGYGEAEKEQQQGFGWVLVETQGANICQYPNMGSSCITVSMAAGGDTGSRIGYIRTC